MAYIVGGRRVARDNRAAGSVAGRENYINGVQPPTRVREAIYYGTAVSTTLSASGTVATGTATSHGFSVGDIISINGAKVTHEKKVESKKDEIQKKRGR